VRGERPADGVELGRGHGEPQHLLAAGSHLLTDFVGAELLRAPAAQPMLAAMREQGSPWLFATADPAPLFTARGWAPAVSGFAEVSDRLGRPTGFGPLSSGLGYLVHATRGVTGRT
jgi:hypothetical protein